MRFPPLSLSAALLVTATVANPIPTPSTLIYPLTATVTFETLNSVDCVLQLTGFGDFTGTSGRIGAYHADTNSCSVDDPTTPVMSGSEVKGIPIMYFGAPYGRAPAGTITVEVEWDNTCHGTIDPNVIGSPQSVTVEKGWPAGFSAASPLGDGKS